MRRGLGGILTGDIIVAFNGQPVRRANDLANALDDATVGDRATLRVLRSDKTVRVLLSRVCCEVGKHRSRQDSHAVWYGLQNEELDVTVQLQESTSAGL